MKVFAALTSEKQAEFAAQLTIMDFIEKYPCEAKNVPTLLASGFFDVSIKSRIQIMQTI